MKNGEAVTVIALKLPSTHECRLIPLDERLFSKMFVIWAEPRTCLLEYWKGGASRSYAFGTADEDVCWIRGHDIDPDHLHAILTARALG